MGKSGYTQRNCNNCNKSYFADDRNLKRGWGLCCSKVCAAKMREKAKPGYNPVTVEINNERRENWNYATSGYGYSRDELRNFEGIGSLPEFNHDEMDGHFSNEDN